jgi:three-Cys-motif partner protein
MTRRSAREALQGYEDREHSLVKHTILQSYLQRCLMITGLRFSKIAYIDCFAGPWQSTTSDLSDTSPGIAIRTMVNCETALRSMHRKHVRIRSIFVDSDDERATLLEAHVKSAPANIVRPEVWRKTFENAIPEIVHWLERDEFAFVFVDPFGWKGLIEPIVLAPFLKREHTELLINFMWNFVNLATGHEEQHKNLDAIFGDGWQASAIGASEPKRVEMMNRYRRLLAEACAGHNNYKLRTAMLPVEYVDKKKIVFYLVYATHSPTGLVVFREQAEEAAKTQSRLKLQHRLDKVAKKKGQDDLFTADAHDEQPRPLPEDLRQLWMGHFPHVGSELVVDYTVIADMIEHSDYLLSELQAALANLISSGVIANTSAQGRRTKNVVNYRKKERLARLT